MDTNQQTEPKLTLKQKISNFFSPSRRKEDFKPVTREEGEREMKLMTKSTKFFSNKVI